MHSRDVRLRGCLVLLAVSLTLGMGPGDARAWGPATLASVSVISYPAGVEVSQPITVRWRVGGGATVSTQVQWGLASGYYPWDEASHTGGSGDYQHTFAVDYAATVFFRIYARIDSVDYYTPEFHIPVHCTDTHEPNNSLAQADAISVGNWYLGCMAGGDEDWFVVAIPACTWFDATAVPAQGPPGSGHGVWLEGYNAAGYQLYDSGAPYCGGGSGNCDSVSIRGQVPNGMTLYLRVWGDAASYDLRVVTAPLEVITDEFYVRSTLDGGLFPWYWQWVDPLGDSGYDPTNDGGVWWISVPGGGHHDLHTNTNAPRYLQWVCHNWAAQTELDLSAAAAGQGAGLLVWQDANNFVRWELTRAGYLRAMRMRYGSWDDSGDLLYVGSHARLHLQRVGMRIDCYAYVGGSWSLYWSRNLTDAAVQVGLYAVNEGAPSGVSVEFDYFRKVAPFAVPPTPTPTARPTPESAFTWRAEAEDGDLTSPMAAHADPEASAGQYVSASENNAGQDRFTFSLSQGGDYWLWARARGLGWTKNSFSVKVDGAPDFVYEVAPTGDAWVYGWREVYPVNETWEPLALSAGPHTLIFKGREADARLDAILVTNDPSYRPVEETPTPGPLRLGLPLIRRR